MTQFSTELELLFEPSPVACPMRKVQTRQQISRRSFCKFGVSSCQIHFRINPRKTITSLFQSRLGGSLVPSVCKPLTGPTDWVIVRQSCQESKKGYWNHLKQRKVAMAMAKLNEKMPWRQGWKRPTEAEDMTSIPKLVGKMYEFDDCLLFHLFWDYYILIY